MVIRVSHFRNAAYIKTVIGIRFLLTFMEQRSNYQRISKSEVKILFSEMILKYAFYRFDMKILVTHKSTV